MLVFHLEIKTNLYNHYNSYCQRMASCTTRNISNIISELVIHYCTPTKQCSERDIKFKSNGGITMLESTFECITIEKVL